jgi:DnaJ-domain-containing protein 1
MCQPSGQASAWSQGAQEYQQRFGRVLPRVAADFQQLQESLWMLEQASSDLKNRILELCRWVTLLDGTQCNDEREILRATADAIGVTLPPASVRI